MATILLVSALRNYSKVRYAPPTQGWENIKEVTPDEWDLKMLSEIESDPDSHEFISSDELYNELGL